MAKRDCLEAVIPTCKGAALDVELISHADLGAEFQHQQHRKDHDYALPEQRGFKVPSKPKGGKESRHQEGRRYQPLPGLPQPLLNQGLENAKESRGRSCACTTVLVLACPSLPGFVWDWARMGKGLGQIQQGPWNATLT